MGEVVLIVAIVIGLPLLIPIIGRMLEHRERMAEMERRDASEQEGTQSLRAEYQEFVLGVDARIQRLEDRIRQLESSRARQAQDVEEERRQTNLR